MDDPRDRLSTEVGALKSDGALPDRYGSACCGRRSRARFRAAELDRRECRSLKLPMRTSMRRRISLRRSMQLRTTPWAKEQPSAAEACLSGGGDRTSDHRATGAASGDSTARVILQDFSDHAFAPALEREIVKAKAMVQAAGLDFAADLPQEWRSLVPSDFGFHNSLRRKDGSLAFVDFEYFGWDDPVKLSADILLHPGRTLAGAAAPAFPAIGCRALWRRIRVRTAARRLYAVVRLALGANPSQRVHPRTLATACACGRDARAGRTRRPEQLALASEFLVALPGKVKDE